jgi:hypothetical protein
MFLKSERSSKTRRSGRGGTALFSRLIHLLVPREGADSFSLLVFKQVVWGILIDVIPRASWIWVHVP